MSQAGTNHNTKRAKQAPGHAAAQRAEDPIFALIDDLKAKEAKTLGSIQALERLRDKINAEDERASEVHRPGHVSLQPCNYRTSDHPKMIVANAYFISTPKEVDQYVDSQFGKNITGYFGPTTKARMLTMMSAAKRELKQMLTEHLRAHGDARRKCGLNTAEEALNAAEAAEAAAIQAICKTVPTTTKGLEAFIEFVGERDRQDRQMGYSDQRTAGIFKTLMSAVRRHTSTQRGERS